MDGRENDETLYCFFFSLKFPFGQDFTVAHTILFLAGRLMECVRELKKLTTRRNGVQPIGVGDNGGEYGKLHRVKNLAQIFSRLSIVPYTPIAIREIDIMRYIEQTVHCR